MFVNNVATAIYFSIYFFIVVVVAALCCCCFRFFCAASFEPQIEFVCKYEKRP